MTRGTVGHLNESPWKRSDCGTDSHSTSVRCSSKKAVSTYGNDKALLRGNVEDWLPIITPTQRKIELYVLEALDGVAHTVPRRRSTATTRLHGHSWHRQAIKDKAPPNTFDGLENELLSPAQRLGKHLQCADRL